MVRILACLVCVVAALDAGPSFARNFALVIGNDDYQNIPRLTKAVGDAQAMQFVLESLGFTVVKGEDATYLETASLLANLENRIEPGDTVLFHFSGHGVAVAGENLLLPIDVPKPEAGQEGVVARFAFNAAEIVASLQARGARVVIGVLDACRDNPFAAAGVRSIGATRGLTRIEPPRGSFIFYSAGAGQTALDRLSDDDRDPSSVFTRIFVSVIGRPGLSLVDIAKETQIKVRDLAAAKGHDQVPAYYDEIVGNLILAPTLERQTPSSSSESPAPDVQTAVTAPVPLDSDIPSVRSTSGDWQIRCDIAPGTQKEQCVLMQFVTAENLDNVGLTVIVLKPVDTQTRILRVLAPLGVLLPSGLGLKIDETDMGRAGFARCLANGCVAEVTLDDSLLERLRKGAAATFLIAQTTESAIDIPISLNGFAAGYDALP